MGEVFDFPEPLIVEGMADELVLIHTTEPRSKWDIREKWLANATMTELEKTLDERTYKDRIKKYKKVNTCGSGS